VISHGNRRVWPSYRSAGRAKTIESLRAMHLVEDVAVHVENARAVHQPLHHVRIPDFVEQRARLGFVHIPAPFDRANCFDRKAV
jgi:hypothetical protein